jgi:hypothetical protein
MYPLQLPEAAAAGAFSTLPMDITQVSSLHVKRALATATVPQWLVVAGWPCQDLSTAGTSKGLRGTRSGLLFDLVRVLGAFQQLAATPPAYIIENVLFQSHHNQHIARDDFQRVQGMLGVPVQLDAAQCGSLAHRCRNIWSNLATPAHLRLVLEQVGRPPGRNVQLALQPNRLPQPVRHTEFVPQHPCNIPGMTMAAWPTLMSRPQSYSFRPGQPGSILDVTDPKQPHWDEPNAEERETALGYLPGSTAAEGITEEQRRQVLGQCLDANTLQVVMAATKALWLNTFLTADAPALHCLASITGGAGLIGGSTPGSQPQQVDSTQAQDGDIESPSFSYICALAAATSLQEEAQSGTRQGNDIWSDQPSMQHLKTGELPAQLDNRERTRIQRRTQSYYLKGEQLMRKMPDGSHKVVPSPPQRAQLISQQHELCGHFGVRRTAAQLMTKYWWYGLQADVAKVVGRCEHCSRVHASFTAKPEQLQSIPISSMGFRWHVDLTGPLPKSDRGNFYIMVAIEAFSKFLVAVPIPDKEAATVAYAFKHNVLSAFAAPGQVVTDSGTEFEGAFAQLLLDCMIDHCGISAAHPQANGQAEKAVHVVKRALQKICSAKQVVKSWDLEIPMVVLGYQCSKQRSTGYTPYELMFARPPVVPPAVQEVLQQPLDFDNADAAEEDLVLRKHCLQHNCPIAMGNLAAAQHRDQLRYLQVRAPDYKPKTHRFSAGEFVYVQQGNRNCKLQPRAKDLILRVGQVLESGVLLLQGRCGRTTRVHMTQCAPCHLPDINGAVDPLLINEVEDITCEVCGTDEQESELLLCDYCNSGFHTYCLQPPLDSIPEGYWLCPSCIANGTTEQDVMEQELDRERLQVKEQQPNLFPNAQTKKRDATAKEWDQRLVKRAFKAAGGRTIVLWGRLHYAQELNRPWYFKLVWEDGDVRDATMAGVKRYLMPIGTKLPPRVKVPPLPAPAAVNVGAAAGLDQQQVLQGRYGQATTLPAVQVPQADIAVLSGTLQFSMAQAICDPITSSPQWQAQLTCSNAVITTKDVKHKATVLLTAPDPSYIRQAVHAGLKQRPALLICYAAGLSFPACLWALWQSLKHQGRALTLRAHQGWWIIIAQPGTRAQQWLR